MRNIDGQTQIYGIIGEPIAHSLSPLFQNHFLEQAKVNACYLPFLVAPKHLKQSLIGLAAANIKGLNVTIPHKEAILPFIQADTAAQTIGAVNTIKHVNNSWIGTNTDWQGFAAVIQGLQVNVSESPTLLFGAGGTSRAILHALHHQGASKVHICNRNPDRAKQLKSSLQSVYPNMLLETLNWDAKLVEECSKQCTLVINSTSIGLYEGDTFPFKIVGQGSAIDAVYKPNGRTAFCNATKTYNSTDGLPMLIAQGIASFAFWFDEELEKRCFNLPNKLDALQWVETQLNRKTLDLPGWRT